MCDVRAQVYERLLTIVEEAGRVYTFMGMAEV
jgi:hypothetical protein